MDWRILTKDLNQVTIYRLSMVCKYLYKIFKPKLKKLKKYIEKRCNILTIHKSYVTFASICIFINKNNPKYTLDKHMNKDPNFVSICEKAITNEEWIEHSGGTIDLIKYIVHINKIKLRPGDLIIFESMPFSNYLYTDTIINVNIEYSTLILNNFNINYWSNFTNKLDLYIKLLNLPKYDLEIYVDKIDMRILLYVEYIFQDRIAHLMRIEPESNFKIKITESYYL